MSEKCWCDENNIGVPGVSCGDCPRDYINDDARTDAEWLKERAAIYEYDAGMSREEADRRARQDLEERKNG